MGMHVTLLVLLPAFAWLTWWQLSRALSGNALSWAYTFEWPLFAGYAVYVWWQLIHDQPTAVVGRNPNRSDVEGPEVALHDQPGWALSGGRRKSVAIAASSPIDEARGGRGERYTPQTPEEAAALAEYNRYLASLDGAGSGTNAGANAGSVAGASGGRDPATHPR
jgi:hypothetical protein